MMIRYLNSTLFNSTPLAYILPGCALRLVRARSCNRVVRHCLPWATGAF